MPFSIAIVPGFFGMLDIVSVCNLSSANNVALVVLLPFGDNDTGGDPMVGYRLVFPLVMGSPSIVSPFVLAKGAFVNRGAAP